MIGSSLVNRVVISPNFEARRGASQVSVLLLHYTGMDDSERACQWLCTPESGVSCHYLIGEDGFVTQMVSEDHRAWHAGVSSWHGETDINSQSIGIEIQNAGHAGGLPVFCVDQMAAVVALCRDIVTRHHIDAKNVLGHSDVAPARKIDPGEKFDWGELHRNGVGHWVVPASLQLEAEASPARELQLMLRNYGYSIEITGEYDVQMTVVLAAFQRHFRPAKVDGVADASTVDTLRRLARHPA